MQYFDITLPVGGVRLIDVIATYVYYLNGEASGADSTIEISNESGSDTVLLKPGQAYKMPYGKENKRWLIKSHLGEATITGKLLMGKGEFSDNRISGAVEVLGTVAVSGTVDVVDGGKERTLQNTAFYGTVVQSAVASQYQQIQIINPAASGKKIIISQIQLSVSIDSQITLGIGSVALSTLSGFASSKLSGGSGGVSELRKQSTASIVSMVATLLTAMCKGSDTYIVPLREPIVLMPGYALTVYAATQGLFLFGSFEHIQESI